MLHKRISVLLLALDATTHTTNLYAPKIPTTETYKRDKQKGPTKKSEIGTYYKDLSEWKRNLKKRFTRLRNLQKRLTSLTGNCSIRCTVPGVVICQQNNDSVIKIVTHLEIAGTPRVVLGDLRSCVFVCVCVCVCVRAYVCVFVRVRQRKSLWVCKGLSVCVCNRVWHEMCSSCLCRIMCACMFV